MGEEQQENVTSNCSPQGNCSWMFQSGSGWDLEENALGYNTTANSTHGVSHGLSCPTEHSLEQIDSDEMNTLFEFIVLGIGICVVATLGIIGNGLSAVVLSRPQMKSSVTCLLLGLTFFDTLLIFISIFTYSIHYMTPYFRSPFLVKYNSYYFPLAAPYLYPTSITAQTASVYLTVAVTIGILPLYCYIAIDIMIYALYVERYIAVCHSLQARSICTWRRARLCVASVITFSIVYNLPRWFEVITVVDICNSSGNVTVYMNEMSKLRGNEYYIKLYINWAYCIIMYLIPFSGLVVFNFAIYRQVSGSTKREMGLASMLLIVVVVFLLCNILPLVNNLMESFWGIGLTKLIALSNFLVILNSSVNFVIYCTCGERFRRLLIRLCRDFVWCRLKGRRGSNGFYRKSHYYRSQHGGDCEEMSLGSVANHTCLTGNGNAIVDLSGEQPKNSRNLYREKNKTIPVVHTHNGRHPSGNRNIDRRISSPTGPRPL